MVYITPNYFAYAALLLWPIVTLYLYSRRPVGQATILAILGAYLLLPVKTDIKFDMVPLLDKSSIPNLAALLGCALFAPRLPRIFRGFGLTEALLLLLLLSPFATAMLNTDAIRIGSTLLPGSTPYDALSSAVSELIFILPFFFGREFLRRPEDNGELLRILVLAGLCYSIPMLFEIRMSPQLHTWIYGYFPSNFSQQYREGGYRPVVFLGHGLLVSFFAMTTTVAAAALWRTRTRIGQFAPGAVTAYLGFVLVLCKTFSAFLYAGLLLPLVRWATPRWQLRVASLVVLLALSYPMLRVADLVPTQSILHVASSVSAARAASLETRFKNEQQLLDHALLRRWFGWGRFGRNRVYAASGANSSITDGAWVIRLGTFGLVGFIAEFLLLSQSVLRAAMSVKLARSAREAIYLSALALIVAINIADLVPNSSISPWLWLMVGTLLGRTEHMYAVAREATRSREIRPGPDALTEAAVR